jgi:hypothetical protein
MRRDWPMTVAAVVGDVLLCCLGVAFVAGLVQAVWGT